MLYNQGLFQRNHSQHTELSFHIIQTANFLGERALESVGVGVELDKTS
jgi:hypothetical protein